MLDEQEWTYDAWNKLQWEIEKEEHKIFQELIEKHRGDLPSMYMEACRMHYKPSKEYYDRYGDTWHNISMKLMSSIERQLARDYMREKGYTKSREGLWSKEEKKHDI